VQVRRCLALAAAGITLAGCVAASEAATAPDSTTTDAGTPSSTVPPATPAASPSPTSAAPFRPSAAPTGAPRNARPAARSRVDPPRATTTPHRASTGSGTAQPAARPARPRSTPSRSVPTSAPTLRAQAGVRSPATASAALPSRSGSGRRVVYSVGRQRVWTVRADGRTERTYLVSGQTGQPDPGRYAVYSRSRHATSAVAPPARMQYMIRFTRGKETGAPIGFHDIPQMLNGRFEQTEAQLGQPLSAGCIRQRRSDAAYLWRFAAVGTTVVVTR
jgi:lipoprotein-anchoring transpeptidase ErfK/SrfK